MSTSIQVVTGPLLRQFATTLSDEEVVLTTKLGSSTVSRVRFKRVAFPDDPGQQLDFVEQLVDRHHPSARQEFKASFHACIADQVKAFNQLKERTRFS